MTRNTYMKFQNPSLAAPVAEWLRWLISLSPLTIRSSHRCDWCGFEPHTGHKWDKSSSTCGCVRWFFPGYSRFRPTFWLARLDMSEIILKGTSNWIKKKKKKKNPSLNFFWMDARTDKPKPICSPLCQSWGHNQCIICLLIILRILVEWSESTETYNNAIIILQRLDQNQNEDNSHHLGHEE